MGKACCRCSSQYRRGTCANIRGGVEKKGADRDGARWTGSVIYWFNEKYKNNNDALIRVMKRKLIKGGGAGWTSGFRWCFKQRTLSVWRCWDVGVGPSCGPDLQYVLCGGLLISGETVAIRSGTPDQKLHEVTSFRTVCPFFSQRVSRKIASFISALWEEILFRVTCDITCFRGYHS